MIGTVCETIVAQSPTTFAIERVPNGRLVHVKPAPSMVAALLESAATPR
jgi:hypothetical protein